MSSAFRGNPQKVRVPNFTSSEKARLMHIIANKHVTVIEDKKTDRASSALKEKAWQAIEKEFNASNCSIRRDAVSLKKCYENRKKDLRKSLAQERRETMLTGGGPPPKIKKDETDDILLSILNKKTVVGEHNPFDDDEDESVIVVKPQDNNDIIFEYVSDTNSDINDLQDEDLYSQVIQNIPPRDSEVTDERHDWAKHTPHQLQAPVSAPLVPIENKITTRKSIQRRRPTTVIKPMTSSHIAKKYDLLLDKRLQIVDSQLKHTKAENELLIKKLKLEIEILETDLAKKKEQI